MLNAFKDNPRRAPHWRWLRAVQIDGGGQKATRSFDGEQGFAWIRRATRLKRHFDRAGNRPDKMYALMLRDSDLFWAHAMWVDEKAPTRWGLEARVLAGPAGHGGRAAQRGGENVPPFPRRGWPLPHRGHAEEEKGAKRAQRGGG